MSGGTEYNRRNICHAHVCLFNYILFLISIISALYHLSFSSHLIYTFSHSLGTFLVHFCWCCTSFPVVTYITYRPAVFTVDRCRYMPCGRRSSTFIFYVHCCYVVSFTFYVPAHTLLPLPLCPRYVCHVPAIFYRCPLFCTFCHAIPYVSHYLLPFTRDPMGGRWSVPPPCRPWCCFVVVLPDNHAVCGCAAASCRFVVPLSVDAVNDVPFARHVTGVAGPIAMPCPLPSLPLPDWATRCATPFLPCRPLLLCLLRSC